MNNNFQKKLLISMSLLTVFIAQQAGAATLTQEQLFNGNNTLLVNETYSTGGSLADSNSKSTLLSFNSFDSNLGTLNNVSVSFMSIYSNQTQARANDAVAERSYRGSSGFFSFTVYEYDDTVTINENMNAELSFEILGSGQSFATSSSSTHTCTHAPQSVTFFHSPCIDSADTGNTEFSGSLDLGPGDFGPFSGMAPVDIQLNSLLSMSGLCSYNLGAEFACDAFNGIKWSGSASVTYEYTAAVPVPATVWLFGSGLIGLIGFARRKKI